MSKKHLRGFIEIAQELRFRPYNEVRVMKNSVPHGYLGWWCSPRGLPALLEVTLIIPGTTRPKQHYNIFRLSY